MTNNIAPHGIDKAPASTNGDGRPKLPMCSGTIHGGKWACREYASLAIDFPTTNTIQAGAKQTRYVCGKHLHQACARLLGRFHSVAVRSLG
jgi:hypothetical protein